AAAEELHAAVSREREPVETEGARAPDLAPPRPAARREVVRREPRVAHEVPRVAARDPDASVVDLHRLADVQSGVPGAGRAAVADVELDEPGAGASDQVAVRVEREVVDRAEAVSDDARRAAGREID